MTDCETHSVKDTPNLLDQIGGGVAQLVHSELVKEFSESKRVGVVALGCEEEALLLERLERIDREARQKLCGLVVFGKTVADIFERQQNDFCNT
jgi:hypothetical protein